MNNDFNYRPQKNSVSDQAPVEPQNQSPSANTMPDFHADEEPAAKPQVIVPKQPGSGKGKTFLKFLLVLVLIAAAAGGVYYWQKSKADSLATERDNLKSRVASLEAQAQAGNDGEEDEKDTANPQAAAVTNIITGNIDLRRDAPREDSVLIEMLYKPGTVDEIWVEYGSDPSKLDKETGRTSRELGLGSGDSYANAGALIKKTDLTPGANYFYRMAAKAKGQTIYGGTVSFTMTK